MTKFKEKGMELVFLVTACVSVISVVLICAFLFINGIPVIGKIGVVFACSSPEREGVKPSLWERLRGGVA